MLSSLASAIPIFFLAVALLLASAGAIPIPETPEVAERDLETRAVNVLSTADISSFTTFTQFARAAYCQPSKIKNWSCGRKLAYSRFDRDRCLDDWKCSTSLASLQKPAVQPPVSNLL